MKEFNGALSYGALHNAIFIPDVGNLGPNLNGVANALDRRLTMTLEGSFVIVETVAVTGVNKGKAVTCYIPVSQFTHMVPKK